MARMLRSHPCLAAKLRLARAPAAWGPCGCVVALVTRDRTGAPVPPRQSARPLPTHVSSCSAAPRHAVSARGTQRTGRLVCAALKMSLRQRRSSEGGPRLSEEDGSGTRARRKSYTGGVSGPNLATPRASGARMSSPRTPRASVSLRPIADDYELGDDQLPAAQQASAELLRCRFQAVLAAAVLMQDMVRAATGVQRVS